VMIGVVINQPILSRQHFRYAPAKLED